MPKRTDIKKIMIIGSGPIVIGQAAEFDYAGTQACIALKEEGYEVILANSNPATIMTDTKIADKVYMEPLDLEFTARIIRYERPDALLCSIGGQTGLNLGMQLYKKGVLQECGVELIGTGFDAISQAEDRELFKELCTRIGEPSIESYVATSLDEVIHNAHKIGFPIILRPAFTLGGTGGGFAENDEELLELGKHALTVSPVGQVLVEKSIKGYKEIEFEVLRDKNDTAVAVCSMENVDPVGIHTGDSIVVAPSQTLTNKEFQMLRNSALKIIRELKIEGGCNIQFSLNPNSFEYFVIEVNPRVSRSSALASKASGYPIARVSAKIACGLTLDEIQIASTSAAFEPTLDYVVAKVPRFPFDKFAGADRKLSTQMKATGEVMSIGRTIGESLLKSIRSLETGHCHLYIEAIAKMDDNTLIDYIKKCNDERIYAISEALRRDISADELFEITKIDRLFLNTIKEIVSFENVIAENKNDIPTLRLAKRKGFSDEFIGKLWNLDETDIYNIRKANNIYPVYKMIDSCAGEFEAYIPYFYSTYESETESVVSNREKVIVLGSGPIRIGQGVEFDYSTVHAVWAIQEAGKEAIIINNNPETVSTDYTLSDKLYFEPLTFEDVMNVIDYEKPTGVIVALGGQTAINLADSLNNAGVPILGSSAHAIALAEDRDLFGEVLHKLDIPMPNGKAVFNIEDGVRAAKEIGYPVLVRPSFVLGGRMMHIVYDETSLRNFLAEAVNLNKKHPVLIDKYISGKECEVDAVCDGREVFFPGIMEHIERAGVHSGDSMSVYPPYSLSEEVQKTIIDYSTRIALEIGIVGPFNIQFAVDKEQKVYIIEVNPRSSRTVPFLAKTSGAPIANIATKVMLGKSLKELGYQGMQPKKKMWYLKSPTFSFGKLHGLDAVLSPEMKSTGEAIGYDKSLNRAVYKSIKASGLKVRTYGTVFATIADADKDAALPLIKRFYELGFNIEATKGTADYLKSHGLKTRVKQKISENSEEIPTALRNGHITYVVNTLSETPLHGRIDGVIIRRTAIENNIPIFTSLDTVNALLNVLEDITLGVATIDADK